MISEETVKKINDIVYECYRLAWHAGEYPDGLEVTSKSVTERIVKLLEEEENI